MHSPVFPHRVKYAVFVIGIAALTVLLFRLVPAIRSVIQIFMLTTLITLALDWAVEWQVSHRIPRWAATLNLLTLLILVFGFLLYFLVPPLVQQFQQFINSLPALWTGAVNRWGTLVERYPHLTNMVDINRFLNILLQNVGNWRQAAQTIFASTLGAVTGTILILVLTFYALLNPWPLVYGIRGLFPSPWWNTINHLASASAMRIRRWLIGTFILSIIIGLLDYAALFLINLFYHKTVPFIFLFAIIGGLLEILPVIGPLIASLLPALVGFAIDPWLGLLVLAAFLFIQQLEGYLIAPLIMQRTINLHPVSLIAALIVLSTLYGIFGAVIAVPVAVVLKVLYDDWYYPLMHDAQRPLPPPTHEPAAPDDTFKAK